MSRYPLGQAVRVSTTVTDASGALATPGSLTLLVKLAQADGTLLQTGSYPSPVQDSLGKYHQDIPATDLTAAGHYQYVWTSTGTAAGVSPGGDFDVFDPFETSLLPLQDGKDQLNIPQTDTSHDTELLAYIASIETSLEGFLGGPVVNRTCVERTELTGDQTVLQVRQRPLVSVTSIVSVASGQALDISSGLDLDANAGTIRRKLGWPFYGQYFTWLPAMTVTYVAGWGTSVPAALNLFARMVLQHMWQTQQGPAVRPSMGGSDLVQPQGFAFMIPNRAAELLNGSVNGMPLRLEAYV